MKFARILLVAILAVFSQARATISVVNVSPADASFTVVEESPGSNSYIVVVKAGVLAENSSFTITSNNAADVLKSLTLNSLYEDKVVRVNIGSLATPIPRIDSIVVDKNIGPGLIITMHATSLGDCTINQLRSARIGEITGNLRVSEWNPPNPTIGNVTAIIADTEVVGDVTNPIILEGDDSEIQRLEVRGTLGSSPSGLAVEVAAKILDLTAGRLLGEIRNPYSSPHLSVVRIDKIETTMEFGDTGEFDGIIRVWEMMPASPPLVPPKQWRFEGEMKGTILVYEDFDDSAAHDNRIVAPHDGWKGRLLINTKHPFPKVGSWEGTVQIGESPDPVINLLGSDINPEDEYAQSAASLGGGSIGVVPFKLHRTDCFPKHNHTFGDVSDMNTRPGSATPILMRHYGPVIWNAADGQPFIVQRRKTGSTDNWQTQDCFTCALDPNNDTIVRISTTSVSRFQRGFEYQVVLRTKTPGDGSNVLRCNVPHLTTANDPEVFDYDALYFKVCNETYFPSAPGDADDNGIVDSYDVDSVLANWGSTACMKFGDADRSGAVNGVDLDIAELYLDFEYCLSGAQGFGPQADDFAQMDLDSDPAAMSAPMTLTQAVQYMGYDDIADFAAGFDAMEPAARAAARAVLMALISGE